MLLGGAGALVHAVLPFACGRTVSALHAQMVAKSGALRDADEQARTVEYVI